MEKNKTIQGGATLWARQTIDSEIFLDKPDKWFKIWFYLVNRVSHKDCKKYQRGETYYQQEWICQAIKATPDQVKKCIAWMKQNNMISTRRSTRGTWVKVNNYERFQTLDNYYYDIKAPDEAPSTSEARDNARNNEPKNTESKTKKPVKKNVEALQKHVRSTKEARRYNKNDKNDKNINNTLQAEPAVATDEPEVLTEDQMAKEQLNSQITEVIGMFFDTINPNINFGNTTTRNACKFLINKYGIDKVKRTVEFAIKVQGQSFAPTITTPYQLKEKMSALVTYFTRSQNLQTNNPKGKEILGL